MSEMAPDETMVLRLRRRRAAAVPALLRVFAILTVMSAVCGLLVTGHALVSGAMLPSMWISAGFAVVYLFVGVKLYGGSLIALDITIGALIADLLLTGVWWSWGPRDDGSLTLLTVGRALFWGGITLYMWRCRNTLHDIRGKKRR